MVEPLFTREHIEGMRPHIQQTVDSLLDVLVKEGGDKPVDLVEKFALPVPSYVRPYLNVPPAFHVLKV
jgi:nitric oxide reductase